MQPISFLTDYGHGDAFAGPDRDPHTVSQAALAPAGPRRTSLPVRSGAEAREH